MKGNISRLAVERHLGAGALVLGGREPPETKQKLASFPTVVNEIHLPGTIRK